MFGIAETYKKMRERVWQYMGKLCYNEGLSECRKCSPKQAKMQFKDYCLQFFSSHVSTKPTLVSLWSTLLHWNWFCQYFYLLKPVLLSVLILRDLVIVLTWLFLPSFIIGLPGYPPTFLWLVLSTGCCVSTSIIDSTLPFWPRNAASSPQMSTLFPCWTASLLYIPSFHYPPPYSPSAVKETWVQSLGWEDSLEKEMATHFRILENPMDRGAWRATLPGVT